MKKFISALTSVCIAATSLVGATMTTVTAAGELEFTFKERSTSSTTFNISAADLAAGDVTVDCDMIITNYVPTYGFGLKMDFENTDTNTIYDASTAENPYFAFTDKTQFDKTGPFTDVWGIEDGTYEPQPGLCATKIANYSMMNFVWRYIDELVGKGLSAGIIIELMAYAMANMIPLGLPLATLLAAIMTMGNLGENYELLAMKSAGMSLPRIMRPLLVVVGIIAVGSFFVSNNLVPYANKKMYSILYDIRQQKQTIEFQDGLFFNGIDNMSIRVGRQNPETHLLRDVLIYDNRAVNGNMNTIVADSGYIRLSDDKKFLLVTLFHGETYEQTRNSQWYTKSSLRHHTFDMQDQRISMDGFAMERSNSDQFSNSQTKNINELQHDIDSLEVEVNSVTGRSYEPLLKEQIFAKDSSVLAMVDSLRVDKRGYGRMYAIDSLKQLPVREKERVWDQARTLAKNSRNMFSFDESMSKDALNQLYRSKVEWHRKTSLPVSIIIFFLIGAPLGAIIRKGGLGMPIVISVIFFVIYYIISITGEKLAKEGSWDAVYGMWLSTFILAPIAVYLTYKATNDSSLLDTDWYAGRIKVLREKLHLNGVFKGVKWSKLKFKRKNEQSKSQPNGNGEHIE